MLTSRLLRVEPRYRDGMCAWCNSFLINTVDHGKVATAQWIDLQTEVGACASNFMDILQSHINTSTNNTLIMVNPIQNKGLVCSVRNKETIVNKIKC